MNMIYREKAKPLTTEKLLEEMHLQWRLSGGKSGIGDKDSNKDDEVALTATGKKGGKLEGKKKTNNSNANKKCNHSDKKGHVEADCWKKFPDKIPEKVKAARKKQEEKKTIAAVAVEKDEEVIFGSIDKNLVELVTVDSIYDTTKDYKYVRDGKTKFLGLSGDNKDERNNKDRDDDNNANDATSKTIEKDKNIEQGMPFYGHEWTVTKQPTELEIQKSNDDEIADNIENAIACIASTLSMTTHTLELEDLWIADTGATSHVTKHGKGGINHRDSSSKMRGFSTNDSVTASIEVDIPVVYFDKDGKKIMISRA